MKKSTFYIQPSNDVEDLLHKMTGVVALTPAAAIAIDPTEHSVFTIVPDQATTFTITPIGQGELFLIVTTSGASSFTLTFGTGFKVTGTLATGTDTAKVFVMKFISDGTTYKEVSRTTAM